MAQVVLPTWPRRSVRRCFSGGASKSDTGRPGGSPRYLLPWLGRCRVVGRFGVRGGALVQELLARRPGLRGVIFDLPQAVAEAAEQVAAAGLAGRCQTVAGSFFQAVPAGGGVYVLAYVLHDWDDPHAQEILGQVRRVIPEDGRLLLVEEVLAPAWRQGHGPADSGGGWPGADRTGVARPAGRGRLPAHRDPPGHSGSLLEAVPR